MDRYNVYIDKKLMFGEIDIMSGIRIRKKLYIAVTLNMKN